MIKEKAYNVIKRLSLRWQSFALKGVRPHYRMAGASIFYTNDKQLLQYQDDKLKLENDTFINKKDGDC